ncbi:4'-phosphopantetheinyl transferase family protein [Pollutibacter soli]|uniref:4'-phosphopantetheinyl transferase family protein n=1 Tax=Pollutibacter soli TaxID=3034157 RepID=UPI0030135DE1
MPLFYQQDINATTRLGIWKITETEDFFLREVPLQREITHPHKRLQHLAGRFLLRILFPDFPYELIRIADTRKPFLENEAYHFSISHCGDYAAAIVSRTDRVGIDVEESTPKIQRIRGKFLQTSEEDLVEETIRSLDPQHPLMKSPWILLTLFWSAKESVYKWYGLGGIDFSDHIVFSSIDPTVHGTIRCQFLKSQPVSLVVYFQVFETLCLSYVTQPGRSKTSQV